MKKVLIVEDQPIIALSLISFLTEAGQKIVGHLTHGETVADEVSSKKPDVVIMDIVIKGAVDGVEAVRQIREFSSVPVIFISGNIGHYQSELAMIPNKHVLSKPIDFQELLNVLEIA